MMPHSPGLRDCPDLPGWSLVDPDETSTSPSSSDPIDIPRRGRGPEVGHDDANGRAAETERMVAEAAALVAEFGWKPGPGGTTGALQLCDRSGRLCYLFKPMMAAVEGTGAKPMPVLREALASRAADEIRRQTGLDFGIPLAVPVILQGRPGVLIQGLTGECLDFERWYSDLAFNRIGEDSLRREAQYADRRIRVIDVVQRQRAMLAKLALGDLDIKWGNVIVGRDHERRCHPIDFGCAFPSEDDMQQALRDKRRPDALAFLPSGGWDDLGDLPLDQCLSLLFAEIDVAALETSLRAASRALGVQTREWARLLPAGASTDPPDDAAIARAMASLRLVQRLLRDGGLLSMRQLADRYAQALPEMAAAPASGRPSQRAAAAERLARKDAMRAADAKMLQGWAAQTALDHRRRVAARDGLLLPAEIECWPEAHRSQWQAAYAARVVQAHSEDGATCLDPAGAVPAADPDRSMRIDLLSQELAKAGSRSRSRGFVPFRRSSDPVMKDLLERALTLDRLDVLKQAQETGLALLADTTRYRTHLEETLSELDERDVRRMSAARQRLQTLQTIALHARAYCRSEIPTHTDRPGAGS